jgi:hypothetical protein
MRNYSRFGDVIDGPNGSIVTTGHPYRLSGMGEWFVHFASKSSRVRLVESGQSIATAARSLGVVEQTLFNWVKAQREGRLKGGNGSQAVNAEQMGISVDGSSGLAACAGGNH